MINTNKNPCCASCFNPIETGGLIVRFNPKSKPIHIHEKCRDKFESVIAEGHEKIDDINLMKLIEVIALYAKQYENRV